MTASTLFVPLFLLSVAAGSKQHQLRQQRQTLGEDSTFIYEQHNHERERGDARAIWIADSGKAPLDMVASAPDRRNKNQKELNSAEEDFWFWQRFLETVGSMSTATSSPTAADRTMPKPTQLPGTTGGDGVKCPETGIDPLPGIFCGRGGEPCPKGYRCEIHPADVYAICCQVENGKVDPDGEDDEEKGSPPPSQEPSSQDLNEPTPTMSSLPSSLPSPFLLLNVTAEPTRGMNAPPSSGAPPISQP